VSREPTAGSHWTHVTTDFHFGQDAWIEGVNYSGKHLLSCSCEGRKGEESRSAPHTPRSEYISTHTPGPVAPASFLSEILRCFCLSFVFKEWSTSNAAMQIQRRGIAGSCFILGFLSIFHRQSTSQPHQDWLSGIVQLCEWLPVSLSQKWEEKE